jgi:hypothetical protein
MPRLVLDPLPTDVSLALRRLAAAERITFEEAAVVVLRDWLTGNGWLEVEHQLDEDTETTGSA